MDAEQIKSLIERIEKSEGADRSIDVLIGAAVRWLPSDGQVWLRDWRGDFGPMPRMTGRIAAFHDNGDPAVHWEAPNFTASLDAAVTLAPEGWRVQLSDWDAEILRSRGPWQCIFIAPGGRDNLAQWWPRCDHASSAPLAICSAALKAKIILDAVAQ